jgi:hypothetical protein
MSFPQTPQSLVAELLIDGVWTDITDEPVLERDSIVINRGTPDGANETPPSRCTLTVNNRNGKFSPRNPVSPYYKKIGRNTPLRVRLPDVALDPYIRTWKSNAGYTTPDSAALSITTVLDLRIEIEPDSWTNNAFSLAAKYLTTGDQRSWAWWVDENRKLKFRSNGTGAVGGNVDWISSAVIPFTTGRGALRTTFENSDGSGNRRVTFYTAASLAGPWTQLGSAFVLAGTTALFDSTAQVEVCRVDNITVPGPAGHNIDLVMPGRTYGFQMYSGLGTSLVAYLNPDLGEGVDPITDAQGNVWTPQFGAWVVNPSIRFVGEVSSWPQEWDTSGEDRYVQIEASGVLRRLQQGNPLLTSPMYRGITAVASNVVAYWPLEDEPGALQLASGIGGPPLTCSQPPDAGSYSEFKASKPVAQMPSSEPGTWRAGVPAYTSPSGSHMIRFMVHIPAGTLSGTTLLRVLVVSSQVGYFELSYISTSNGQIRFRAFDTSGTQIVSSDSATPGGINDKNEYMSLDLEDTGSALHWNVIQMDLDQPIGAGGTFNDGTLAATDITRVRAIEVYPNATSAPAESVAFGHLSVQHGITSFFELDDQAKGWIGERAGDRFSRLTAENGVPAVVFGDPDETQPMGAQPVQTLATLLRECATADIGQLLEPRDFLGLMLRTRLSLTNQIPALELDYDASQLTRFKPIDDDQLTRNDMTVNRPGGSSARVIATTGPLSVNPPPDGAGQYDDQIEANVETDAELTDHAGWRVHLGTIDESRFPDLALTLARSQLASLRVGIAALDVGDRITVDNPPADRMPPDQVSQLAWGFTETLSGYVWDVVINGIPESGWQAAVWGSDAAAATDDPAPARYAPDASNLAVAADSTQTALLVNTSLGPLWSTQSADYPQDIWVDGERCELSAVGVTPSLVAVGTGASGTGNTGITAGLPAGTAVDDVVAIFASIRNSGTGVPVRPDAWYEALNFSNGNARLYLRRYDGIWTMPAVAFTGGAGTDDTLAQSASFRGVDWPAISALSQLNGSAQNIATPALPVPEWAGIILGLGWKQDDWSASGAAALGGEWTEINERTSTAGNDAGQVWDYQVAPMCATGVEASSFTITGGAAAISRGAVICLPVRTPAANSNPYFETDASGWTNTAGVAAPSRSTAQKHSGTASALLATVGTPANWSITSQSIVPSIQGQLWSATAWVRVNTGASIDLRIVLAWADETQTALSITAGTTTTVPTSIWTPLTVTGFSPAGTGFAQIRLQALNNPVGGSQVHADEIELTSPRIQGFTVARSQNGVVKSHTAGTDVRVNPESFWSL